MSPSKDAAVSVLNPFWVKCQTTNCRGFLFVRMLDYRIGVQLKKRGLSYVLAVPLIESRRLHQAPLPLLTDTSYMFLIL